MIDGITGNGRYRCRRGIRKGDLTAACGGGCYGKRPGLRRQGITIAERIAACSIHLQKSIEWKGPKTGIFEMRRHYSNYFKGMEHFKEYRMQLVTAGTLEEVSEILNGIAFDPRYATVEAENV